MKVLKAIGAAILAAATVLGGVGSFAQWAGIEFTGVVGAIVGAAPAWLPIASLLLGILAGYIIKGSIDAKKSAELEKRPTQEQMDAALAERDARVADLERNAPSSKPQPDPNPLGLSPLALDVYRKLEPCDMEALERLCCASVFGSDGKPRRPLIFQMADHSLARINLDCASLERLAEAGAVRIYDADDRQIVGTNVLHGKVVEVEDGVKANPGSLTFKLAEGDACFSPRPVDWGTDSFVAKGLFGIDFGVAEFTRAGKEIAGTLCGLREPRGLRDYIRDEYAGGMVRSRHRFSYVDESGEIKRP